MSFSDDDLKDLLELLEKVYYAITDAALEKQKVGASTDLEAEQNQKAKRLIEKIKDELNKRV